MEPTVIVFAGSVDAFDLYVEKLVTAIGPACQWSSDTNFAVTPGACRGI